MGLKIFSPKILVGPTKLGYKFENFDFPPKSAIFGYHSTNLPYYYRTSSLIEFRNINISSQYNEIKRRFHFNSFGRHKRPTVHTPRTRKNHPQEIIWLWWSHHISDTTSGENWILFSTICWLWWVLFYKDERSFGFIKWVRTYRTKSRTFHHVFNNFLCLYLLNYNHVNNSVNNCFFCK